MTERFTCHTDSQRTVCSIYLSLLRFSSIAIELKVDGQRALIYPYICTCLSILQDNAGMSHAKYWHVDDNWATSCENVSSGIFDQVRFKPVCSATEASYVEPYYSHFVFFIRCELFARIRHILVCVKYTFDQFWEFNRYEFFTNV